MLSDKLIAYFKEQNWWYEAEDIEDDELRVLKEIKVPLDSSFAFFFLHVSDGPTFISRNFEIYHVCWNLINTNGLQIMMNSLWEDRPNGVLPKDFIPFSPFERDTILLFNIKTNEVFEVDESGIDLLVNNNKTAKWDTFNDFLEWYFELS